MSETSERPATLTITLPTAIRFDNREYQDLVLHEPSVKQVLRADEQLRHGVTPSSMRNREIHLVSLVAGVPVPVIEQLPISTLNRAMAYISPFLTDGQATGEF